MAVDLTQAPSQATAFHNLVLHFNSTAAVVTSIPRNRISVNSLHVRLTSSTPGTLNQLRYNIRTLRQFTSNQ